MEIALTLIAGILGSAGLFSFIQFLVTRHDSKSRDLGQIKQHLTKIENKCDTNTRAINRLQLLLLINTQPKEKDTILQTAQRYFVELNGNGEAWAVFYEWAEKNKLDIGWYKALIEREKGKK